MKDESERRPKAPRVHTVLETYISVAPRAPLRRTGFGLDTDCVMPAFVEDYRLASMPLRMISFGPSPCAPRRVQGQNISFILTANQDRNTCF
jgi:hypothetical protein